MADRIHPGSWCHLLPVLEFTRSRVGDEITYHLLIQTEDRFDDNTREDLQYRPKWKVSLDGQYASIKSTGNILFAAAGGLAVPRVLQKLQANGVVNPASSDK